MLTFTGMYFYVVTEPVFQYTDDGSSAVSLSGGVVTVMTLLFHAGRNV